MTAVGDLSREQIVDGLRRAGLPELATVAADTLPEQVGTGELEQFCSRHGISRGQLVDRLGGSP